MVAIGTEIVRGTEAEPGLDARLQLGVSTGSFYPVALEATPSLAAAAGFSTLEVMVQARGEYDRRFLRRLRRDVDAVGGEVHALHIWQEFHPLLSPYRRRVVEGERLFDRVIVGAAELGARAIVWHGPKRAEVTTPEGWRQFLTVAGERAAACGAAGVTLAFENVSWCALASVRDVAALARRVPEIAAPGHLGFAYDPFQAVEAGANPFMLLAAMGEHVVDVHLSDRRADDPTARHLPAGEGELPWPALLRAIAGAYAGPLMLEGIVGADRARLVRSREFLAPLVAAMNAAREDDDPCAGSLPPGLREGIALFNRREFYACHEVIEIEWHAERRPIRRLYQGILQIGVGFHHALNGNHRGAILLLSDGIAKTSPFLPRCAGVETGRLVTESQRCLDQLRALGGERLSEFDAATIPTIRFAPASSGTSPLGATVAGATAPS